MGLLRIGTCSWKYPSWEGLVYSSREPEDFLAEYARRYSSVEVDQWFWSLGKGGAALPRPETVAEYDEATPADFRFTVKCPNSLTLTHRYAKKGEALEPNPRFLDPGLFLAFLESLGPLLPKVGLFIFQFEYLNRDKMPSREAFLRALEPFAAALPPGLPYGLELRNPRWLDGAWFDFLRERGLSPVLLQGYWMDDLAAMIERHAARLGGRICIRLHGEDREGMEEASGRDWSRIIRPKDEELARISASLRRLVAEADEVFLNVNNHYEGSAPLTIRKLEGLLGVEGGRRPA